MHEAASRKLAQWESGRALRLGQKAPYTVARHQRPRGNLLATGAAMLGSAYSGACNCMSRANLDLALHHAPADDRRVAVAIAPGHRLLEYLVHQVGATRSDAVLPGKLPRIREILDGVAY